MLELVIRQATTKEAPSGGGKGDSESEDDAIVTFPRGETVLEKLNVSQDKVRVLLVTCPGGAIGGVSNIESALLCVSCPASTAESFSNYTPEDEAKWWSAPVKVE